jgi:hypothetical protein
MGKFTLYTADGGFDVEGKENLQEILSIPLILGEVRVGVQVLDVGGVMILKMFTFFTPLMKTLIIWLGRHFQQYTLIKPAASSQVNSEIYFVGVKFKGPTGIPVGEPETVLVEMTPEEAQFINTYQQSFVGNQIAAINALLKDESKPLDEWSYRRLSPISKELWIPTAE